MDGLPEISPDYSFGPFKLFTQLLSYVLAGGFLFGILALIACIILIMFKGFGNQGMKKFAADSILWVILGVVLLAGINGLMMLFGSWDLNL